MNNFIKYIYILEIDNSLVIVARALIDDYKNNIAEEQQKIEKYKRQRWTKSKIKYCDKNIERLQLSLKAIQYALDYLLRKQRHKSFEYIMPPRPADKSDDELFLSLTTEHCDHFEQKVLKERQKITDAGLEMLDMIRQTKLLREQLERANSRYEITKARKEIEKLKDDFLRHDSWLHLIVQQANSNISDLRKQCQQGLIRISAELGGEGLSKDAIVESSISSAKLAFSRKIRYKFAFFIY